MGKDGYITAPLNTEALQKTYPEVYRDFFSSCDFVFSAPATFLWCGGIASRFGGLGCGQKIPLRIYVRIALTANRASKDRIQFGELILYENRDWKRLRIHSVVALTDTLESYLLNHCPQLKGSVISFLYEYPHGVGLNTAAALGAAFCIGLKCINAKSSDPAILLQKNMAVDNRISTFDIGTTLDLASQIRCIFTTKVPGDNFIVPTALLPTEFPIVAAGVSSFDVLKEPFNQTHRWEDLPKNNGKQAMTWDLPAFLGAKPYTPLWPIDIARIYLGRKGERAHLVNLLKSEQKAWNAISQDIIPDIPLMPPPDSNPWQTYLTLLNLIDTKVIHHLGRLLKQKDHASMMALIDSVNKAQLAYELSNIPHMMAKKFLTELRQSQFYLAEQVGAIINDECTAAIVIGPLGALENTLPSFTQHLADVINPGIRIDWASWRDGFENDGARVEHAPSLGIVHKLTGDASLKGSYAITIYHGDGTNASKALKRLDPTVANLFLDEVREKIWCGGKPVSAKELPSQRMAIMLLKQLLATPDSRVANTALPRSSYTSYRNELQSKIIGPLRKLVKKRLQKEIALGIEGSLTKFHIVRGKDDVTIAIRKK